MIEVILANARLTDRRIVDIHVVSGRISELREPGEGRQSGAVVQELGGRLVVPSFVDGHCHLDKTLFGSPWHGRHRGDSVIAKIELERSLRRNLAQSPTERANTLLRSMVLRGTGALRSHVDIDPELGLDGLHELSILREKWAKSVQIQLVAFPQSGVIRSRGVDVLLDAAMSEGADVVGGLDPGGIDGDVDGQLDIVFSIAVRHSARIDIHLHDGGILGLTQLAAIADRTRVLGLGGRVVVSHAYVLAEAAGVDLARIAASLAGAGVAIVTSGPAKGTPPVLQLMEAGVEVFAGSDNIRDAWSPFGRGDMLERASLIAYQAGFTTDEELGLAFEMITSRARVALGIEEVKVGVGSPANLVALDASCIAEAVAGHSDDRLSWHRGSSTAWLADERETVLTSQPRSD